MTIGFGGGLAAFMNGFQKGQDRKTDRARQKADDEFMAESRQQQRDERVRRNKELATDDAIKLESAALPLTRDGAVVNPNRATDAPLTDDSDVEGAAPSAAQLPAPQQVKRFDSELLNDQAAILAKHGRIPEALKFSDEAHQREMKRSAGLFSQLQAGAGGQDLKGLLDRSIKVFNDDPGMANLENVRYDDKGGVTFDVFNKQTQQRVSKSFADPKQLLDDLHSYYSPDSYEKIQAARRASALKREEEDNKVHIIPAGGEAIKNNGRSLGVNNNGYIEDGTNADGTPRLVKAGGRAGATGAAGAKAGKSELDTALKTIIEAPGGSLPQDQVAMAQLYGEQVLASGVTTSAKEAAAIAHDAATHPERLATKLNIKTGTWDRYYQNPTLAGGANIVIAPNIADAAAATQGMDKKSIQGSIGSLLAGMGNPAQQATFLRAAHDPAYRQQMEASAQAQGVDVAVLGRKLDLLRQLPAPAGTTPAAPVDQPRANPLKTAFGLGDTGYTPPAGSPAAAAQAARAQARGQNQAKASQASQAQLELSRQFQLDRQTLAPLELVRKYDALRRQLPPQDGAALQAAEKTL